MSLIKFIIGKNTDLVSAKIIYNVTLHGSCLIFSKDFMAKRKVALFEKTKFYCEAQILDYECRRDGMLQVFAPKLQVLHHEDVATDAVTGNYAKKMIKKYQRVLESLDIFRQLILNDETELKRSYVWMRVTMNDIAIALATYNGEKYIKELLVPIANQDYQCFTCYIHDDGSSDDTAGIIRDFIKGREKQFIFLEYPSTGSAEAN